MVNRSKPSWWKWSQRSYWYFTIGTNVAVIVIAVSAFFLGIIERFPILTLAAIPIIFITYYTPRRFFRSFILIMAPAAAAYMTTLLVMVLVFEDILFPVLSLAFILGAIAGYYLSRRAQ